jgi:diacylglycerol kinase
MKIPNKLTPQKSTFPDAVRHALNGIIWFFIAERNGKIQAIVMLLSLLLSFIFKISVTEWCLVLLCNAIVISLEVVNTAIEQLCNEVYPGYNENIKFIKDASAGAVLISSVFSIVIAALIFVPKLFKIIN